MCGAPVEGTCALFGGGDEEEENHRFESVYRAPSDDSFASYTHKLINGVNKLKGYYFVNVNTNNMCKQVKICIGK